MKFRNAARIEGFGDILVRNARDDLLVSGSREGFDGMAGREEPLAQEEALEVAAILLLLRCPVAAFLHGLRRVIHGSSRFFQIVLARVRTFCESVFAKLISPTDRRQNPVNVRG